MSRYTWLLDPGHGGIIDGEYQTVGKRSPTLPDGTILYEGVFNREIVTRIIALCYEVGRKDLGWQFDAQTRIEYGWTAQTRVEICDPVINLVDTNEDMSLNRRVDKANRIHQKNGNSIYVSIHANAFGDGKDFNSANGIGTFHHYQSTSGKKLAEVLQPHLVAKSGLRDRGVVANDKWANFYVLRKTNMPAILSENGFMTNLNDAEALMTDEMKQKIAEAHFAMMLEIEENGL